MMNKKLELILYIALLFLTVYIISKYSVLYENYLQAVVVFVLGLKIVDLLSKILKEKLKDTGIAISTLVKILGIGVLLSIISSILSLNASSAITLGSFLGLVVGFATQTIMKHLAAGIFLIVTRSIKIGEWIKIDKYEGRIKEIKLMHVVIQQDSEEIYIPSGKIVENVIIKKL